MGKEGGSLSRTARFEQRAGRRKRHAVPTAATWSPYFINNPEKQVALLDNPSVLLFDKKISNIRDLLPTLEAVAKAGRPPDHRRGRRGRSGETLVNTIRAS